MNSKTYVRGSLLSEGFQRTVELVGSILGSNLKLWDMFGETYALQFIFWHSSIA